MTYPFLNFWVMALFFPWKIIKHQTNDFVLKKFSLQTYVVLLIKLKILIKQDITDIFYQNTNAKDIYKIKYHTIMFPFKKLKKITPASSKKLKMSSICKPLEIWHSLFTEQVFFQDI